MPDSIKNFERDLWLAEFAGEITSQQRTAFEEDQKAFPELFKRFDFLPVNLLYHPNGEHRQQWGLFALADREGKAKPEKLPFSPDLTWKPKVGCLAATNHPQTWGSFIDAADRLVNPPKETIKKVLSARERFSKKPNEKPLKFKQKHCFNGAAFWFDGGDVFGIDIDNCFAHNGELKDWAAEIVANFSESYMHRSPSKRGLHIFGLSTSGVPNRAKQWQEDGVNCEIAVWDRGRYFTFSSDVFNAKELVNCDDQITWLSEKYDLTRKHIAAKKPDKAGPAAQDPRMTAKVLRALEVVAADDYHRWVSVGRILHREGFSLEMFNNWSKKSSKYEHEAVEKVWYSF